MLNWTKYHILEKIKDDRILLWNTFLGKGITLVGNIAPICESEVSGVWSGEDSKAKQILQSNGFLIEKDQYDVEGKLISKMRSETVYDDSFMSITIIPTDTCNFNCIYCYQSDTIHNMSKETADSIIRMIARKKTLRKLHISWFGGEPLCNKEIVFYIMEGINRVCKERGIVLIADMTTNASLLDLPTFIRLYDLKVLNYQITIDGCKKTHDVQRPLKSGGSSYDMILKNLRDIRDNAKGRFFKIGIRTNFTDFVDNQFAAMKDTLEEEFSNDSRFYFFFQWVKNWGGNRISGIMDRLLSDDEAISHYGRWMDQMAQTSVRTGDITLIRPCSGLCVGYRKNSFIVDTDGSICKCTTGMYDKDYRDRVVIGKIEKNGLYKIDKWKEIDWLSMDADQNECEKCAQYPICLGMPCPYYKIKHKRVICNKKTDYVCKIILAMEKQGHIQEIRI